MNNIKEIAKHLDLLLQSQKEFNLEVAKQCKSLEAHADNLLTEVEILKFLVDKICSVCHDPNCYGEYTHYTSYKEETI